MIDRLPTKLIRLVFGLDKYREIATQAPYSIENTNPVNSPPFQNQVQFLEGTGLFGMKIGHDKKTNTMSYMNKEMAACFKD
jgi:hypothetical protein